MQFPEHKCSQSNNQNIDENDNNNNEMDWNLTTNVEPNINKNNRESREPIAFCMSCGIEKKEFPNVNFIECPTCKKTFCDSCSAKHYRLNQTHSQPLDYLNNINQEGKKPVKEEKCIFCGVIHRLVPTRIFYDCNICKGCICFLCKKTHDSKFYNHRLINPRRYEGKTPMINTINDNNNSIKNRNNNNINNNLMQKKEEVKKGLYTIFGEPVCFICRKNFDKFHFCNQCMRLYCLQCNMNRHKCNY